MGLTDTEKDRRERQRRASSLREFCDRYRIGLTTGYREIAAGRLKATKIRDRTIILPEHEDEYVESLRLAHSQIASA